MTREGGGAKPRVKDTVVVIDRISFNEFFISQTVMLPLIPTKSNIIKRFNLYKEPDLIFIECKAGLEFARTSLTKLSGVVQRIRLNDLKDIFIHLQPVTLIIILELFTEIRLLGDRGDITFEDLLDVEDYYLKTCNNLFNIHLATRGPSGFKHTPETKQRLSELATGRRLSDVTKIKISEIFSGSGNPFFGKTHSEESKVKISVALKGSTNYLYNPTFLSNMKRNRFGSLNENASSCIVTD
ncbi:hypothetical protein HK096_000004 [Nowakowskiella sp. JEL0078]|nr:hypothetical protein HK096_000004 [Nowakowskiella sp. JEL0078]